MKKKIILPTILMLSLPSYIVSCNSKANNNNYQIKELLNPILESKNEAIEKIKNQIEKNDQKLLIDIERYANDDSILFYSFTQEATTHKYVPLAHLLNVLQINPEKQIYLFVYNSKRVPLDFETLVDSKKYPNIKLFKFDSETFAFGGGGWNYGYEQIPLIKQTIINDKIDSSKIVWTSDEYYFLQRLIPYAQNEKIDIDGFINDYLIFFNFRELNLIADGTATTGYFYSNLLFDYIVENHTYFKYENDKYELAIEFMKNFKQMNESEKENFIRTNRKDLDIAKILWYLIIASKNNNQSDFTKVNFFVPSLEMILDANNKSSTHLSHNEYYELFFNPFNTYNLDFVSILKMLSGEQYNWFIKILKLNQNEIAQMDNYEEAFNDAYNVIFSGSIFGENPEILKEQSETLIAIFKENEHEKERLKIWYKAHPREIETYQELLKNELTRLGYSQICDHLNFLNNLIPMEIFIGKDYMKTDETKNRYISFYSSFSTINLFFFAAKQQIDLKRIIVSSENDKNFIIEHFGDSNESIIYNDKNTILLEDFKNLYIKEI